MHRLRSTTIKKDTACIDTKHVVELVAGVLLPPSPKAAPHKGDAQCRITPRLFGTEVVEWLQHDLSKKKGN